MYFESYKHVLGVDSNVFVSDIDVLHTYIQSSAVYSHVLELAGRYFESYMHVLRIDIDVFACDMHVFEFDIHFFKIYTKETEARSALFSLNGKKGLPKQERKIIINVKYINW